MRVIVLTRENTDYARIVDTFITDFKRQTGKDIEVIDADDPAAVSLAETYDIMDYPTILALASDGQLQNSWSGNALPTISEVSYYAA